MVEQISHASNVRDVITIWPHRSLSPRGFALLMGGLAFIAFALGTGFYVIGAWPVIGFLGLEFGVLYFAFKYNYYAAKACEQLLISDRGIEIIRISPTGRQKKTTLASLWMTAEIEKFPGKRKSLGLRLHGQFHEIGAFLPPAEKTGLKALINEKIIAARLG